MIGSLESGFRMILCYNCQEVSKRILCPLCKSMTNPHNEIDALNNFLKELKKLEKSPLPLKIPADLRRLGFHKSNISMNAYKTHSRIAEFVISESSGLKGAETSDITVLVTHEYISPQAKILVDEKISFLQAKMEKNNGLFKITPRQWYLMKHWPEFFYKRKKFNLVSCRRVPDVCSFYLLLFKQNPFIFGISNEHSGVCKCDVNSIFLSAPHLGEKLPELRDLREEELLKNNDISLRLRPKDTDTFFGLLWDLLLTDLGAHDPSGVTLMQKMFPKTAKRNNPHAKEESDKKPSIGVKIGVRLRTEF